MTSVWTHLRAPFGGVRRQAFTPTSETARLEQLPLEGTSLWVLSADVGSEVMMSVRLERPSAESVQGLIRRVDALGGPSCAVALAHGKPRKAAFYRRGE